jgi:hypothetical protein
MPAPELDPNRRLLRDVAKPETFEAGQRIWVHRAGSWRPGIVLAASPGGVMIRYRPNEGRGTGVDTVTSHQLVSRDDDDPFVDRADTGELPLVVPSVTHGSWASREPA